MKQLDYSFVIPVYNRPGEIRELLESFRELDFSRSFEIVIVEDGSTRTAKKVVEEFRPWLEISYYVKRNTGPGDSRNYGMKKARADYFIILDSDVLLPPGYLRAVDEHLSSSYCDCFGGPDAAHPDFSDVQKAINYAMTSLWTTGGIRGKKKAVTSFEPRSFNMGVSREAFEATGGFGNIHPGEDPDLSLRLREMGFATCLIPEAGLYHKRRVSWNTFYLQVRKFGLVRPVLNLWHPGSARLTYWFPSLFMLGLIFSLLLLNAWIWWPFFIYLGYFLLIGIDAANKNKSLNIGLCSVFAVLVQFTGYGYGFLKGFWQIRVLGKDPELAFPHLFFKHA